VGFEPAASWILAGDDREKARAAARGSFAHGRSALVLREIATVPCQRITFGDLSDAADVVPALPWSHMGGVRPKGGRHQRVQGANMCLQPPMHFGADGADQVEELKDQALDPAQPCSAGLEPGKVQGGSDLDLKVLVDQERTRVGAQAQQEHLARYRRGNGRDDRQPMACDVYGVAARPPPVGIQGGHFPGRNEVMALIAASGRGWCRLPIGIHKKL
jgi:hypothetical protein